MRENCVQHDPKLQSNKGLLVATIVVMLWIGSLVFLSSIDLAQLLPGWILLGVLGRTFIQTGLFIVAHDAIHGSVCARNRKLNDAIGQFAVRLYAVLDYQKLAINHRQHHLQPGQAGDPDFHDCNRFIWYLKFMKGYLNFQQLVFQCLGLGTIFMSLHFGLHVPVPNLFLFWILPIFFSTIQLFFFGTYLPHRPSNPENSHQATSSNYPPIWSFLTCYHFGYHWEHHEYPWLAWYDLPSVRQVSLPHTSPFELIRRSLPHISATLNAPPQLSPYRENDALTNTYRNGAFTRGLRIHPEGASSPPRYYNGRLVFDIALDPGGIWHTCIDFIALVDGEELVPKHLDAANEVTPAGEEMASYLELATQLHSSNRQVEQTYQQALTDLAALRIPVDGVNTVWIPAAGIPWFVAVFGRDPLIASLQTMSVAPNLARGTLIKLAQLQATEINDWQDAQPERAQVLRLKSDDLYQRFNDRFWMEDEGFYCLGLDSHKQQIRSIASNAGQLLWSGIVPVVRGASLKENRAKQLVERLFQPDLWCGWGIRTLSAKHPAYDPIGYHTGSVWAHDNSFIAAGLKRYGYHAEANRIAEGMFAAANMFQSNQMPELFGGIDRLPENFPVPYVDANISQAWAAGAMPWLISSMLGLKADAPNRRLQVQPLLLDWLPNLHLTHLNVGDATVDLHFWCEDQQTHWQVVGRVGELEVVGILPPPLSLPCIHKLFELICRSRSPRASLQKGGTGS
jgi:fatty acid desaturase